MALTLDFKRSLCGLFDVQATDDGMRVVTPLCYRAEGDQIVVRVRRLPDGGWRLDENGEAAFNASLSGAPIESDAMARWADGLNEQGRVTFDLEAEELSSHVFEETQLAPAVLRLAEAAHELYSVATAARVDRKAGDLKQRVVTAAVEAALRMKRPYATDVELPISGGFVADVYIESDIPLIVIAAATTPRLLEAEITHMQYRAQRLPGYVLAVVDANQGIPRKQVERANYYTGKTVSYAHRDLEQFIATCLS
jgi:hypothetical protein